MEKLSINSSRLWKVQAGKIILWQGDEETAKRWKAYLENPDPFGQEFEIKKGSRVIGRWLVWQEKPGELEMSLRYNGQEVASCRFKL